MCGILGTVPGTDHASFKTSLDTLAHRGPDGQGIWSDAPHVSLGHRRLAILDLSPRASQPMHYGDRYTIVFNGEIYNFMELQKELTRRGYSFSSTSDTEVLLAAYIEWGPECLLRCNGMWAFAIWDSSLKHLFLARDRFGKKPLYYAFTAARFVFASEMKAIFPFLSQVRPARNIGWFKENIHQYESTDKCVIEGISRFPAGHYGYLRNGTLALTRYWNTLDRLVEVPKRFEDQVAAFEDLFVDSCRLRMRSDVPIGTALSGGIDSSSVAASVAKIGSGSSGTRISQNWQNAFVACFPKTSLDETGYAKRVAEHCGINAVFVNIDPLSKLDELEEHLYLFEDIYFTSPLPFVQLYGAMREHGVIVSLDGHGADELLCGYEESILQSLPDCGMDLRRAYKVMRTYQGVWPAGVQFPHPSLWSVCRNNWRRVVKSHLQEHLPPMAYELLTSALRTNLPQRHNGKAQDASLRKIDHLNRHLWSLTCESVLPTLLRNYDRYSMIRGVEVRMPFMDHRVVSFALSLPWDSIVRGGFTKAILREAMSKVVPEDVIWRRTKIGWASPIVDWMKAELREFVLDTVHSREFLDCDIVDARMVRHAAESVIANPNARLDEAESVWTDIQLYLWNKAIMKRSTLVQLEQLS